MTATPGTESTFALQRGACPACPATNRGRLAQFIARAAVAWLVAFGPAAARADYTVTVRPAITWGTWEGWGTSLCWWANVFGFRDDLANLIFTTGYVGLNGQTLPGLGMNIARYNAGACSFNSINGETIQLSPNIPVFKRIQGFWLDWFSSDPSSASWNWAADANQRVMLLKAKARGANLFELFSNSPMWWMCYNHNPSGADDGSRDNLQSWNYDAHAAYLATIAKYGVDHWGIHFDSVEPFNEPSGTWWTSTGTQEGCHFAVDTQAAVIGHLREELDQRGLSATLVSASDETSYDAARGTWNGFSAATWSQVGRVNVHGIQTFEIQNVLIEPPPPELKIAQGPGRDQVTVSWPGWATGFVLLSGTNLSRLADWVPVTNNPVLSNNTFNLTLPLGSSPWQFFRMESSAE